MTHVIELTKSAIRDLRSIERSTQNRILDKLEYYATQNNPLQYATNLKNHQVGSYRFRIGNYRAIFDIDHHGNITILLILRIKHRKDAYL